MANYRIKRKLQDLSLKCNGELPLFLPETLDINDLIKNTRACFVSKNYLRDKEFLCPKI